MEEILKYSKSQQINFFWFEERGENWKIQRETLGRIVEKQQTPPKCLNQDMTNTLGFRPPFTQL